MSPATEILLNIGCGLAAALGGAVATWLVKSYRRFCSMDKALCGLRADMAAYHGQTDAELASHERRLHAHTQQLANHEERLGDHQHRLDSLA